MQRTVQPLLATVRVSTSGVRYVRSDLNAYLPDLSEDWWRPPHPVYTTDYSTNAQVLT